VNAPSPLDALTSSLADAIAGRVLAQIAELAKPTAPATLTQAELARELRTSTRTVRTLVKEGLPELRLADSPRYELAPVLAWLRDRETKQRAE
jgi:hypothetical protein